MAKVCMVMCLYFALALVGILFASGGGLAADFSSCHGVVEAQSKCLAYMRAGEKYRAPSMACCEALKYADLECGCKHVTPEFEETISWPSALLVANYCQKPVKHGTTCGKFIW